jgi:hypothetical protein
LGAGSIGNRELKYLKILWLTIYFNNISLNVRSNFIDLMSFVILKEDLRNVTRNLNKLLMKFPSNTLYE